MDNLNLNSVVTPEEQNAEKEMTTEVTDEQLREKVIADFGLNPNEHTELIDKLVADKKASHEKLSSAIKQKINWRTKATSKTPDNDGGTLKPEDVSVMVSKEMEKRELESLNLPDEIKNEIRTLADLKNISVREAAKLPYITSMIEENQRTERINNASPHRTNIGGKTVSIDFSKPLNPADFNLATEEGRKDWENAKLEKSKYRQSH